jgi:hypothetical protein
MSKFTPSPEQIARLLASIPEGFIREATYARMFNIHNKGQRVLSAAVRDGVIGRAGSVFYDLTRLDEAGVRALATWCQPSLPPLDAHGQPITPPVVDRRALRAMVFTDDEPALALIARFSQMGYARRDALDLTPEDRPRLDRLIALGALASRGDYIYDPLVLSDSTVDALIRREEMARAHTELLAYLRACPGMTASMKDLEGRWTRLSEVRQMGGLVAFRVDDKPEHTWLRLKEADPEAALRVARAAIRREKLERRQRLEPLWEALLARAGDRLRPGAAAGKSARARFAARTYSFTAAAQRLSVDVDVLMRAVENGLIEMLTDPNGKERFSVEVVEAARDDAALSEAIAAPQTVGARGLAVVAGVPLSTMKLNLLRAGVHPSTVTWGQVRGKWGLPDRFREYRTLFRERIAEVRAERERERERLFEQMRQRQEAERERREALRAQLLAIFPTWEAIDRSQQHLHLHIGPTNSGKTHDSLNRLAASGSGWYLAPLRLLAYEIFERLNVRGIPCNLLTGEEYIPIPGATITAATIEMFNPHESGECVIIDEAHMFADPDRGAAWTRALMEAQSPEIHVLGAPLVRPLIERLTRAIGLPMTVYEHTRLTPIRIADQPWSLKSLPPRTILVAFSRKMVLALKVELERHKRSVAVVYGNLPPEVRRRQSERFASEACEICVATDAVGMGLNLPADNVCFYEMEKFDGSSVRTLHVHEVQQIGGRAGRFGLSEYGTIGALKWENLRKLRALYEEQPPMITRARISPTVEAIELIPGTLADRLREWAQLQSIPDALRGALAISDMTERIELASMLSEREVAVLGFGAALKLINAPTRQESRAYWRSCASAILASRSLPLPSTPPTQIHTHRDLDVTEACILEADIYLWLGSRQEFRHCADREDEVRAARTMWSLRVDEALVTQIDTARRCSQCGNKLPLDHRFSLCDSCFQAGVRQQQHSRSGRRRAR